MDAKSGSYGVLVWGLAILLVVALSQVDGEDDLHCPCSNSEMCRPIKKEYSKDPEVYVFSRGTTDVHLWTWKSINTLVVPEQFQKTDLLQADTMCIAHGQGKKFGVTVEFNVTGENPGQLNMSATETEAWRVAAYLKKRAWFADTITVDLLPYFKGDKASDKNDHAFLAGVLYGLKKEIKNTEILCVVPWKPPCSIKEGACDFAMFARDGCDYFLLNPDSYLDTEGSKCVARANIPFSKMLYGISEYNAHHIATDRLVLGVTWHGYDYTCASMVNDVCSLQDTPHDQETTKEDHACDFEKRKRISYGDVIRHHSLEYANHKQNKMYNAPFFNYKDGSVNHQVWFEDHDSLKSKYRLAHELNLRGIAILYGDDLSPSKSPSFLSNEGMMWSWVSHDVLLKTAKKTEHKDMHWADTVAGVAVGCFLLGVLLGIIFTCISMQKRVRKPLPPFRGDRDPLGTDYTDDPDL